MSVGAESDEVLLIESGAVKVVLTAANGTETIVGVHGPGELMGELGVISGDRRSATVIAHRDGSAVHIPGAVFNRLAHRDPRILMLVNDVLSRRLRHADARHLTLAAHRVATRVAVQLLIWADSHGEPHDTGLEVRGISQRELAQAVAASEKHVEAALRALRVAGLVATSRLRYVLPDRDALARLVDTSD